MLLTLIGTLVGAASYWFAGRLDDRDQLLTGGGEDLLHLDSTA